MKKVYNVPKLDKETLKLVKKYSDRELVIHNKFSKEPLNLLFKKCLGFC